MRTSSGKKNRFEWISIDLTGDFGFLRGMMNFMHNQEKSDVCIIGGGVIGASIAIRLAEAGAQVQLIERNKLGMGCSYGNAGWITPCFALPLPMPGMFWQSLKWLLNPESPLYIQPSLSPTLLNWLKHFLFAMTKAKAFAATQALVELSKESLKLYHDLSREYPEAFGFQQKGLLMVAEAKASLISIEKELEYVGAFAVPGKMLSATEIKNMEPAIQSEILGGAYFSEEAHLQPWALMQVLRQKAQKLGVKIIENCEVLEFVSGSTQIQKLKTTQAEIKADIFVLATGTSTRSLAQKLGDKIPPILGGKGYSMLLDRRQSSLSYPVMVLDRKLALTPHLKHVRVAGTLELVQNEISESSMNLRRAQVLLSGAQSTLGIQQNLTLDQVEDLWTGLRPCTPDGLPVIGFSKKKNNLMYAAGHQMLGLQSALGTGKLVTELILEQPSFMQANCFSPGRFAN